MNDDTMAAPAKAPAAPLRVNPVLFKRTEHATTDWHHIAGLSTAVAVKAPCRCASTANVALEGLQTVDGVVLVAGDRVLVKNQAAPSENGIYVASSSGWTRTLDFDGGRDAVTGTLVYVISGSTNSDSFWHVSTAGDPDPGDAMAFARSNMSLAGVSSYFQGLVGLTNGDALLGQLISDMGAADLRTAAGLVIGTNVLAPNGSGTALTGVVKNATSSNVTVGYTATAVDEGTKSTGTFTPDPATGNLKRYINGGAHTLAPPSATGDYSICIQLTNNASAGAITTSGFTKVTGSALTTVNGDDFMLYIVKLNGFSHLNVVALQ